MASWFLDVRARSRCFSKTALITASSKTCSGFLPTGLVFAFVFTLIERRVDLLRETTGFQFFLFLSAVGKKRSIDCDFACVQCMLKHQNSDNLAIKQNSNLVIAMDHLI